MVASFARQLAAIAAGAPPLLLVGNLEAQRDFLDVRDVVAAYVLLLENGRSGEVYNISSGRPVAIREVLRQLITIARVPVEIREDPARMRASDLPVLSGDCDETSRRNRLGAAAFANRLPAATSTPHAPMNSSSRGAANCSPCPP